MWGKVYWQGRRPIFVGVYPPKTDMQGAIPRMWCAGCGTELFLPGHRLCQRCKEKTGGN